MLCNEVEASNRRIVVDKPFHFQNMLGTHHDFVPMVDRTWNSWEVASSVALMKAKLDRLAS